jgi:hypothetical protein
LLQLIDNEWGGYSGAHGGKDISPAVNKCGGSVDSSFKTPPPLRGGGWGEGEKKGLFTPTLGLPLKEETAYLLTGAEKR